jgi:hypothetical protein
VGVGKHQETKGRSQQFTAGALLINESMIALWEEQKLCDVVLHANSEDIRAHKMALAAYSDFLVDKFCHFPAG